MADNPLLVFPIRLRCPHCGNACDFHVENVSLLSMVDPADQPQTPEPNPRQLSSAQMQAKDSSLLIDACGMARCAYCNGPVLVVFRVRRNSLQENISGHGHKSSLKITIVVPPGKNEVNILKVYPDVEIKEAHSAWPDKVKGLVLELEEMVAQRKNPGLIIAGCRSVLDVSTKQLATEPSKSLKDRIDQLSAAGILPGTLAEWAHKLRLDGNAATHELDGTAEEAEELTRFVRLFLQVCFELPAQIRLSQATVHD